MIGGPAHGQDRDIAPGDDSITIMGQGPDGVITPIKYMRRGIQAQTNTGSVYQRDLLVEASLSIEVAAQALAAVLLQRFADELVRQFMEGGELIGTETGTYPSGLLRA